MKLALRIKELVDARGMDAQQLAAQAGIDPETAQHIYDGRATQIDLTTLGHICGALGVLPHDIVVRVEEPQESVIETGEMPRDPVVHTQDPDEIKTT